MFESILETKILNQNEKILSKNLNCKAIGLYFSSSQCKDCVVFSMILKSAYDDLKKNNIEIIYVSSDSNIDQFNEYYSKMPWLAIPYIKRSLKKKLCETFAVSKIPRLVFINDELDVLTTNGVDFICNSLNYSISELENFN